MSAEEGERRKRTRFLWFTSPKTGRLGTRCARFRNAFAALRSARRFSAIAAVAEAASRRTERPFRSQALVPCLGHFASFVGPRPAAFASSGPTGPPHAREVPDPRAERGVGA